MIALKHGKPVDYGSSQLFLSNNDEPNNKTIIATYYCNYQESNNERVERFYIKRPEFTWNHMQFMRQITVQIFLHFECNFLISSNTSELFVLLLSGFLLILLKRTFS